MRFVIPAVAIVAVSATSAFAQEAATDYAAMTCAELLALDDAGQTEAIDNLRDIVSFAAFTPDAAAETGAASTDADAAAGGETTAAETTTAETGADTAAASETAAAGTETEMAEMGTEAEGADTEAAGDGTGSTEAEIAALRTACEGTPDTLAAEAMAAVLAESE